MPRDSIHELLDLNGPPTLGNYGDDDDDDDAQDITKGNRYAQ